MLVLDSGPQTRPERQARKIDMASKSSGKSGQTIEYERSKAGDEWQVWGHANTAEPRTGPSSTVDTVRLTKKRLNRVKLPFYHF